MGMDERLYIISKLTEKFNWMDYPVPTLFIIIALFFLGLWLLVYAKSDMVKRIGVFLSLTMFFCAPPPVYEAIIKPLGKEKGLTFIAVSTVLILVTIAAWKKIIGNAGNDQ